MRIRLDAAIVKRGLATSRAEAARLIEEGNVTVSGTFATKASRLVGPDEPIGITTAKKFVSRGGEKLEHALQAFDLDVRQRSVLDAGVSTGGFTDCVLQHGAKRVFAIDVGKNQLHERMKADKRVTWRDGVNVRELVYEDLPFDCSLVVADLSFISLSKVLAPLMKVIRPELGHPVPQMVLLVKPQFEAGREEVSKGRGVITDPSIHQRACSDVAAVVENLGGTVRGVVESPIKGGEGNIEFLMFVECPTRSVGLET